MREYICEAWESGERKLFQCVGLFSFLVVIYGLYLAIHLGVMHVGNDQFATLCLISALPFAVLAFSDSYWRSNDAAPVCVLAWIAASIALSFKCPVCVVGLAVTFFPFVLSAILAHGFGTVCRFFTNRLRGYMAE